ncbi:sulfatase [Humisphaera borealis]|uniref:Sulfatase n=1 Tax=Humisphaera borealis TaxID=2807512 RepID=A0A7M2X0M1_9BACT|nr:sulfatase [Humisphaera borealis]QOV91235.1 sulfatase [Humisphaera borealis]
MKTGFQSDRSARVCLLLVAFAIAVFMNLGTAAAASTRPPNVVLILMDDMGWRDVGFVGNKFVETPNIDRLAKTGLVFKQSYSSAPNCAPTRACLMSGQYTPRHGIYTVVDPRQPPGSPWHKLQAADSKADLATETVTVAESLQAGGYATGFFGMWNLGRGRTGPVTPGGQGFQQVVFPENLGFAKDAYFDKNGNYLSDRLTDEVVKFIEQNRERPFFAYFPDHAVHAPFEPKPDLLKKYQQKLVQGSDRRDDPAYAATIEAVDHNVGRLLNTLERLKLSENTVVIFTSDNGGTPQYTAPLKGSKGQLYEGGIRVPLVVTWPGLAKPGTSSDVPVASIDIYPTLLDLAGLKPPAVQVMDGVSLMPVLKGQSTLGRERLYWHFPCYVGRASPSSAVREGDFKLVESFEDGGRRELYNLLTDPNEEHDLSTTQPEKAAAMYRTLQAWQKETHAALPTGANPNYDPKADRPRGGQPNAPQNDNPQKKGREGGPAGPK